MIGFDMDIIVVVGLPDHGLWTWFCNLEPHSNIFTWRGQDRTVTYLFIKWINKIRICSSEGGPYMYYLKSSNLSGCGAGMVGK